MNRSVVRYAAVASVAVPIVIVGAAPSATASTTKVDCAHHSLQSAINKAHSGATVAVKGHCVGTFTIAKNLTIKGNPSATLDAAHKGAVVTIKGKRTVTLSALTVTRGKAPVGGGIHVLAKGLLTLKHVTVSHDVSTGGVGGGIAAVGGAVVRISDSKIVDNEAQVAATSTNLHAEGGGLAATGKTAISKSTFSGNVAHGAGAAASSGVGGAIYATGGLTVDGSTLSGNTAQSSAVLSNVVHGGAIAWLPKGNGGLAIKGSTLSMNTASINALGSATGSGGALYLAPTAGSHATAKISASTVHANTVSVTSSGSSVAGQGGGLDAAGLRAALTVFTSTFSANRVVGSAPAGAVSVSGGGVETSGSAAANLDSSIVDSNQVAITAAGQPSLEIGGGLQLDGTSTDEIINSTISRNSITASGLASSLQLSGGGIASYVSVLRVRFSTIDGNSAVSDSPYGGGGLYANPSSAVRVDGSILAGNNAVESAQCLGPITSGGFNVYTDLTGCSWTAHTGDKLTTNAKLGAIGAHGGPTPTIPLDSGSPALNIAAKADCDGLKTDQRGVKRPQGNKCDAGAYERKA